MGPYGIKENLKTKNPKEDKLELSSLPITVETIKLENQDPPAKFPSKKSKRKSQSESEPQEIPGSLPVPVENIKMEKNADSHSVSIMTSQKTKSKKIRLESVDVEVPIISKIKLEREDNPSKHSSRKSKIINLLEEPHDISALFPIPVGNIKCGKSDPRSKKSKNIKQEEDDVVELPKPLPGPIQIIKLEQEEDPPAKIPSKKSKRMRLEQERQESHSTLQIPIEKIKLGKEDQPSKKSKKIRPDVNVNNSVENLATLLVPVEKIKLKEEDPPSKYPSRKLKKNKLDHDPQEIVSGLPISVENYKLEKDELSLKKSKKIVDELPSKLPVSVDKIKLEKEDPPSKYPSKESMKNNLELAPELPIPVENIKLEQDDSDEIVYMHFNSTTSESMEIEKEEDQGETETAEVEVESEWKTPKLFPCRINRESCRVAFWTAQDLKKHLENVHSQCKIPECLKFIAPSQMDRHFKTEHPEEQIPKISNTLFPCSVRFCCNEFTTAENLNNHLQNAHGWLQCKILTCNKICAPSEMKIHVKSEHGYPCTIRNEKFYEHDHLLHIPSTLPVPIEKIKPEDEDYPSKSTSKKSKRNKSEFDPEEVPAPLQIPVQNIKLEEEDLDEIVYMRFTHAPESVKVEKEDEEAETETAVSEKRSKKKKDKSKETQPTGLDSDSKTPILFPCQFNEGSCGVAFRTAKKLERHLENAHSQFTCVHCAVKFSNAEILDEHMGIAHNLFRCADRKCEKYCTPSEMKRHMKKKHGVPCKICNKKFPSQRSIDHHLREVHAETKEYTCKVCQQTYQSKFQDEVEATRNHLIRKCPVPGVESFQCKDCEFVASTKRESNDHDCRPTERRVKCFYPGCGDLFANQQKLSIHRSTANHWMNIRYTCFCKLQFPTMEALRTHRDSEHVLGCNFGHCTKTFLRRQGLESHVKSVHKGIPVPLVYSCKLCEIPFKYKTSLEDHMAMAHDDHKK